MPRRRQIDFLATLTWRANAKLLAAIFLVFAPTIVISVRLQDETVLGVATVGVVSGLIGMLWAAAFLFDVRWLWPGVALQALVFVGFSGALPAWAWPRAAGLNAIGLASVLCIAAAYGAFMWFIGSEGSRSLRERAELEVAHRLHQTLTPTISIRIGDLEAYAESRAATEMGGDLVDVIQRRSAVIVALLDVSGHGVRAGVVMAAAKIAVRTGLQREAPLDEVVRDVNRALCESLEPGLFATGFLARFVNGSIELLGCGHPPALLRRASGAIERFESAALPLGVDPDESFEITRVSMSPGDHLLLYSDGLSEAGAEAGRALGVNGVQSLFAHDFPAHNTHDIATTLLDEVNAHAPPTDDRSVLLVKRIA